MSCYGAEEGAALKGFYILQQGFLRFLTMGCKRQFQCVRGTLNHTLRKL